MEKERWTRERENTSTLKGEETESGKIYSIRVGLEKRRVLLVMKLMRCKHSDLNYHGPVKT